MGRVPSLSISRGKRGIAGTLQFVLFDRDALGAFMEDQDHWYYAHAEEINWLTNTVDYANYHAEMAALCGQPGVARSTLHRPDYMDQIWPFDVTLVAQNEYGQGVWSAIIELLYLFF
ncbi:MAG: hypothetical protein N2316_12305 [Spirochaetes bacterium]|nr:hypothetical protein [Spirochaetota bacterium]